MPDDDGVEEHLRWPAFGDFDELEFRRRPMYFDRQGRPISVQQWSDLMSSTDSDDPEGGYKRVQSDHLGDIWVSTVWLGIDHGFGAAGPPIIFETMIFGGPYEDNPCARYSDEAAAREGHDRAVRDIAYGRVPWMAMSDDYDLGQEPCPVCGRDWHGLDDEDTGCPGAFATEVEVKEWKRKR